MSPWKRVSTLGKGYEAAPIPRDNRGKSMDEAYPMQKFLAENMPESGAPWWAQPRAPMWEDDKFDPFESRKVKDWGSVVPEKKGSTGSRIRVVPSSWSVVKNMSPWVKEDTRMNAIKLRDRMARGLKNRYGNMKEDVLAGVLAKELGLTDKPARKLTIDLDADPSPGTTGRYLKDSNKVEIGRDVTDPDTRTTTLLHEMAHAADVKRNPFFQADYVSQSGPEMYNPPGHFEMIQGEQNLADTLDGQMILEGSPEMKNEPWMQEVIKRNPWLNRVQPYSSNPLANPWKRKP